MELSRIVLETVPKKCGTMWCVSNMFTNCQHTVERNQTAYFFVFCFCNFRRCHITASSVFGRSEVRVQRLAAKRTCGTHFPAAKTLEQLSDRKDVGHIGYTAVVCLSPRAKTCGQMHRHFEAIFRPLRRWSICLTAKTLGI